MLVVLGVQYYDEKEAIRIHKHPKFLAENKRDLDETNMVYYIEQNHSNKIHSVAAELLKGLRQLGYFPLTKCLDLPEFLFFQNK